MRKLEFNVGSLGSRVVGYIHDRVKEQCQTHSAHPALIILPGGGYWMLSSREADPVALKFFAHAINTFTLYYPILDDIRKEKPVETLKACVQYIVDHAAFLGVDTSRMAVLGFSAGGHLAASYGTICKGEHLNTMLLGYPVISSRYMGLNGKTFKNLCQSEDEVEWYSLENRVDDDTLPSFIFHTADDAHIPVENSLVFAQRTWKLRMHERSRKPQSSRGSMGGPGTGMAVPDVELRGIASQGITPPSQAHAHQARPAS